MSALRTTALAAVTAAFLVAPPSLLADPGTSEPAALSSAGPAAYGAAAQPSATVGQPAASASLRTTDSHSDKSSEKVPAAETSDAATVTIGDFFFRPQDLSVNVGDSVTWTNDGTVPEGHTVTGDGFDSGVLKSGDTFSHTFSSAGSFDYVCTLHPNMRGTVTVTAAAGGGDQTGGGIAAGSGDGSATGAGSSTVPTTPAATSSSDGSLPTTGLNLILLAEIGGCLIATGLLVRRLLFG